MRTNATICLAVLAIIMVGPAEAAKAPVPNHQMGCFNHDFLNQPDIGQTWGYHALYWKACLYDVPFNYVAANPPGPNGPSPNEFPVLNDEEANVAVFPTGDPPGGWVGFWNHPHPSPDEEEQLMLASALCMDRWNSPLYTFAEISPGFTTEVVIRAVRYGSLDPATACCNWFNGNVPPNEVSADCAADHDFQLQYVWYGWWDHNDNYFETVETGATFMDRLDHVYPWHDYYVCDPPEPLIPLYLQQADQELATQDVLPKAVVLPCQDQ